jgi:CRISPR-associated exonuclease Cas4
MMTVIIIIAILLLVTVFLFAVVYLRQKSFGSLSGRSIYSDTKELPGMVLYSDTLKLKGKPDYILKKGNEYIPVEVKTGKTPLTPYPNHVAQLVAYCVLVEEKYNSHPKFGVIKYPEKEFQIEYTNEQKEKLKKVIKEMVDIKKSGQEPTCSHPEHN